MSELIAIVSGGSSGIGRAVAELLALSGCRVFELSRREQGAAEYGVIHIQADICDETRVRQAVEEIVAAESRIDVLINNAGFGISGAFEFCDGAACEQQLAVNLFGMANLTRAVIPHMRRQGWGRIINVSSVAAETPIPFQAWYSASKAAINSLTMALANELRPFDIQVCAVMPGDICTGFTQARSKVPTGDDVYQGRISRAVGQMEADEQNGMAARCVAEKICRLAFSRRLRPLYTVGGKYQFFVFLSRVLPKRLVNWIIGKMYG